MDATTVGAGAGLAGVGLLANAYGNVQGAEAMARVRANQRAQQERIQGQANAALQKRVGAIDISGGLNKATSDLNDDAVKRFNVINAANPDAGGSYGSALAQGTQGQGIQGLADAGYTAAPDLFGSRFAQDTQNSANEQRNYSDQANAVSQMYDRQLQAAGQKGQVARLAGGLATQAGGGIASYGMWANPAPAAQSIPSRISPQFTANLFGDDLMTPMAGATMPGAAVTSPTLVTRAPATGFVPQVPRGAPRYTTRDY